MASGWVGPVERWQPTPVRSRGPSLRPRVQGRPHPGSRVWVLARSHGGKDAKVQKPSVSPESGVIWVGIGMSWSPAAEKLSPLPMEGVLRPRLVNSLLAARVCRLLLIATPPHTYAWLTVSHAEDRDCPFTAKKPALRPPSPRPVSRVPSSWQPLCFSLIQVS